MLTDTDQYHQTSFFGTDLLDQLDATDPLLMLAKVIPWEDFEQAFGQHYADNKGSVTIPSKVTLPLRKPRELWAPARRFV